MRFVTKIEKWMVEVCKNAPSLSAENKDLLVRTWPWVALIFGVLQILSVVSIWSAVSSMYRWSVYVTYAPVYEFNQFSITMAYINMAVLVVTATMLLVAYAPLKVQARRGWELLFMVGLINVASAVIGLFTFGQGVGSTIFSVAISAMIFYLLIQVRDRYNGKELDVGKKKSSAKDLSSDAPKKQDDENKSAQ